MQHFFKKLRETTKERVLGFLLVLPLLLVSVVLWSQYPSTEGTEYYANAHAHAPIASLAGADLEKTRAYIHALESGTKDVFLLFDNLKQVQALPLDFQKSLVHTEHARRVLLHAPTKLAIQVHNRHLEHTIHLYIETLSSVSNTFGENPGTMHTWQGVSSSTHIQEVLARTIEHAQKLLEEQRRRVVCADMLSSECPSSEVPKVPTPILGRIESVSSNTLLFSDIMRTYIAKIRSVPSTTYVSESLENTPLVSLSNSLCGTGESKEPTYYLLSWNEARTAGMESARINEVNNLRFYNFRDSGSSSFLTSAYKEFTPHTYQIQQTNPYLCVDYGADLQRVLTIMFIRETLLNEPVFKKTDNPAFKKIRALEEEVTSPSLTVVSDTLISEYVDQLALVRTEEGTKNMAPEVRAHAQLLMDTWRDQSGWYEYSLGSIGDFLSPTLLSLADTDESKVSPFVVLSSYIGLPTTLQLSNMTFRATASDSSLLLERRNDGLKEFPFVYTYLPSDTSIWKSPQEVLDYIERSEKDFIEAERKAQESL